VANTIPGVQYQYFSKPRIHRTGKYDNLFPSASFKYRFTRNLDFHFGFSSTIRRPTIRDLAGVWSINDTDYTVNAPNPNLKPETSKNLAARVAYYFEPVGIFAVNAFQNTVKGLYRSNELSLEEFGYRGDLDLVGYRFITTVPGDRTIVLRGMEIEYSQSLSFLPRPFQGLNCRFSYTRNYSEVITPNMSPHGANAGLNYSFRRLQLNASTYWRDNVPTNIAGTSFNRHRMPLDIGGGYKLSSRYSLFFTGRNLLNEPVISMQQLGSAPAVVTTYEMTGAIWTFGVKGVW
jgi:iron complex outermembrane recepter protein